MGAIKKAFQTIGKGIEKAAKSVGEIAKGVATLDLKGAANGVKDLAQAGLTVARGAINLTPVAVAANTLLDGAADKLLNKAQGVAQKVADSVVDNVEGGLSNIKDGVVNTAKAIGKGNFSKALQGIGQVAMGAVDTASNFGPGGVAKNLARMAADAAIGLAGQEAAKAASKVLNPDGDSRAGALASDLVGAAVGGGLGGSRAGRFASAGEAPAGMLRGAGTAVRETAQEAAVGFAGEQVPALASKVQSALGHSGIAAPDFAQLPGVQGALPSIGPAVGQFVDQTMARTVLEAVPFSVGKLQGSDLQGLAGLPKSQGAADEPQRDTEAAEPQTPQQIRQQMTLTIERSIAQASQQAKEAIQQRVQQALQETQRLSASDVPGMVRAAAMPAITQASHQVFDAVDGAIGTAARRGAALAPAPADSVATQARMSAADFKAVLGAHAGPLQMRV